MQLVIDCSFKWSKNFKIAISSWCSSEKASSVPIIKQTTQRNETVLKDRQFKKGKARFPKFEKVGAGLRAYLFCCRPIFLFLSFFSFYRIFLFLFFTHAITIPSYN
jgi:hypothetical protein